MNSDQGVDPNSINQFAYVCGNPLMHADPSGMRQPTEAEEERDHPRPSVDGDQNDQNDQDSDPESTITDTTNNQLMAKMPDLHILEGLKSLLESVKAYMGLEKAVEERNKLQDEMNAPMPPEDTDEYDHELNRRVRELEKEQQRIGLQAAKDVS